MNRLATITLLALISIPLSADAQVRWVEYEVRDGDTCSSIAAEVYGDPGRYDLVHQSNELGEPPHNLEAGQKLRLPKVPEALLAQERGPVMFKAPESDWSDAKSGVGLYRAWRLNTLERARALLEFRDESEMMLRENTLVVIYGGSADRTKRSSGRAKLESGALRTRLGELGGAPVAIETESSESFVGPGMALITVDEGQTARVANHGGDPIVVRGKAGGEVAVDEGFGSKVDRGKPPAPPRPLPPTPVWESDARGRFPTFHTATVTASWSPVAEAKEYFVELTADRLGVRVMQAAYVPADVRTLEVANLPPGEYFATVSAIDEEGFESIPAAPHEIRVVAFEFDRRFRLADDPPRFLAGATIESPDGLKCATSGAEPATSFVAQAPTVEVTRGAKFERVVREMEVECQDASGAATGLNVEVEVPGFELTGSSLSDGTLTLPQGRSVGLDVRFTGRYAALETESEIVEGSVIAVGSDVGRLKLVHRSSETGEAERTSGEVRMRLAGVDLLILPVTIVTSVEEPEVREFWELNVSVLAQSNGALLRTPETRGGLLSAARLGLSLLAGDHFRAGAFVDLGGVIQDEPFFAPGLGFEVAARAWLGPLRPYVGLGFEAWAPALATGASTAELTIGTDIPIGGRNDGLRLGLRGALQQADGEPGLGLGGSIGYFWAL